jgi:hypothetical protein
VERDLLENIVSEKKIWGMKYKIVILHVEKLRNNPYKYRLYIIISHQKVNK